jgi:hypothetical protein
MAHFAQIDNSGLVLQVIVAGDEYENTGEQIYSEILGGFWKKTSYNTRGGVHILNGIPFRKNFAGVGYTYDEVRDAFIPPKIYDSWLLNEFTCLWEPPVPHPGGDRWQWDESKRDWVL